MAKTKKSKQPAPTLIAWYMVNDTRVDKPFKAQDFTRAWRSMRCWAWRNDFEIIEDKVVVAHKDLPTVELRKMQ